MADDSGRLLAIRRLCLEGITRPLTVSEARLLGVCRVCRKDAHGPLELRFGQEFAHPECLSRLGEVPKLRSLLAQALTELERHDSAYHHTTPPLLLAQIGEAISG